MPDLLEDAISLARMGFSVFPLIPDGKTPSIRADWRQISTDDLAVVSEWPLDDNIGIDCGKSGLVVVDVDVKATRGDIAWNALWKRHEGRNASPETFTVMTASGGFHVYFEARGVDMGNSVSLIGSSIDIRAQGGYVVGAGSVIGGRSYRVANAAEPMPVPGWLVEVERACRERKTQRDATARGRSLGSLRMLSAPALRAKLDGLSKRLAAAPPGERNNLLHWTACRLGELAAAGLFDEDDAWELCLRAAEVNGHLAWGEAGVRATFLSGFGRGFGGVR